jgi:2-dehydropantoate 2-reductase
MWQKTVEDLVCEATAVAAAEGEPQDPEIVLAGLRALHKGQMSSLARDVARGDTGELDQIAGAVVRAGERHRIPCPAFRLLIERIRKRAAQVGKQKL